MEAGFIEHIFLKHQLEELVIYILLFLHSIKGRSFGPAKVKYNNVKVTK